MADESLTQSEGFASLHTLVFLRLFLRFFKKSGTPALPRLYGGHTGHNYTQNKVTAPQGILIPGCGWGQLCFQLGTSGCVEAYKSLQVCSPPEFAPLTAETLPTTYSNRSFVRALLH